MEIYNTRYPNPDWPVDSGVYCWDVLSLANATEIVFQAVKVQSPWRQGIALNLSVKGRLRLDGGPWRGQGIDVWFDEQGETHTVEVEPQGPAILRIRNGWLQEEYGVKVEVFSGTDMSGMKIDELSCRERVYHCNGPGGSDFTKFVFALEWDGVECAIDRNACEGEVQPQEATRRVPVPAPVDSTAPPTTEQLSTALASSPLVGAAEDIIALARPQWFALEASEAEASSFLLDPSGAASGPTPVFALDLAEANADLGLPRQGALIFSYDAYSKPWGDEPADAGSFSVMLSQASAREEAEASGLRSVAIRLVEGIGLPAIDSLPGDLLPIDSDDEAEAYLELLEELYGEPGSPGGAPGTWLLGYPYQLQDDMQEQCAEMAKSTWGLESEPAEWRLLLQLASESAANMCWEDDGFLYYWIRESDLAKHDFSHVWCILQTM